MIKKIILSPTKMNQKREISLKKYLSKIDIRVFLVFIILLLLGLFTFFFQLYRHVDCREIDFRIEAQRKQVGEVIEFYDKTPNAQSWEWDFGDKTEKIFERNPLHKYTKPGIYTVSLEVNGDCTYQRIIEIRDLGRIIDAMRVPKIVVPTVVMVGDPVEFYYNYKGEAFSWEWSFGETGQMDNTSEYPAYSYSTPGVKKVTLIVNGDVTHISAEDIYVKPRKLTTTRRDTIRSYAYERDSRLFELAQGSPQKDPLEEFLRTVPSAPEITSLENKIKKVEENKAPHISQYQFELSLLEVAKQSKTMDDFLEYSCGNSEFPVIINNDKIISFSEFCERIKGKKIRIESLRITKNNRNCIEGLSISYKVKKSLFWVYDK